MEWWRARWERWRYSLEPKPMPPKPKKVYPNSRFITEPIPDTGESSKNLEGFHVELFGSRLWEKDLALKLLNHVRRGLPLVGSTTDDSKLKVSGDGKTWNLKCVKVSLDLCVANGQLAGYKLSGGQTFL